MDWLQWIIPGLMLAWILYSRFAGKVSPAEAKKLVAEGATLVDVRTAGEFASGALPGARNIPVGELVARVDELGPKDRPVVVYCRSGARSAAAKGTLLRMGFTRVEDLGPLTRW